MRFNERINAREPRVAVIGLGYVGLPLALELVSGGCEVIGVDIDEKKTLLLGRGKSYIKHIASERIVTALNSGRFRASTDFSVLSDVDAIIVAVPTPLGKSRQPDLSYIISTARSISEYLSPGQLVILESTTYPGTTRDEMIPVLEMNGLKAGRDFLVAFSPEREDPGNKNFDTRTIPKLVGGITEESTEAAAAVYSRAVKEVVPVSSPEVAEMAKILENTYRAVNIALVNELKVLCQNMGINIWEVISAASTKPFGFTPFFPGPGLGGHCIPIDPFYLTWKAHQYELPTRFIELAGEINTSMPDYVVQRVTEALNNARKSVNGSRILILGMAYKPDIDDYRETPALKIIDRLIDLGAEAFYNDPYIPEIPENRQSDFRGKSVDLNTEVLSGFDCVIIITDHENYDYQWIVDNSKLIIDTRNACSGIISGRDKVVLA